MKYTKNKSVQFLLMVSVYAFLVSKWWKTIHPIRESNPSVTALLIEPLQIHTKWGKKANSVEWLNTINHLNLSELTLLPHFCTVLHYLISNKHSRDFRTLKASIHGNWYRIDSMATICHFAVPKFPEKVHWLIGDQYKGLIMHLRVPQKGSNSIHSNVTLILRAVPGSWMFPRIFHH